jgi:DNA helicase-2/ATP-dependent DNA helicase PcrA
VDWRRTGAEASASGTSWRSAAAASRRTQRPVPALQAGDKVTHDAFGLGTVVATRGGGTDLQATVDFGGAGVKVLLVRYAPVEKL